MKRSRLKVLAIIFVALLMLSMLAACGQQGEQGPAGPQGEQGVQGEKGDDGNGISSIIKTSSEGLVDTYTITFTDGETTTFTVTNGADGEQGIQGIQGVKGEDGHTPIITIQNGYWYIDGVNTNQTAIGISGATGNGISNIAKTSTEGLVDTYTITFTNGDTATFTVTNGADGSDGKDGVDGTNGKDGADGEDGKDGADGKTPYIKDGYWWVGDTNTGVKAEGTDGSDGKDGVDGTNGKDGTDGKTPYIKDGYWWIGDTNTGVKAEGTDGSDGKDGVDGTNGKDGTDGKTPYIKDGYWWIGDTNTGVKAEGTDGSDGKDGVDGTNGKTPYIKDGYWWIGDINTGVKAEGTDGSDGKDGVDGTNGKDGTDGENGKDGADGVSVVNAYVDEDFHLWIVLSNGTKIDAGYVGVAATEPTPTTYTVTFVDYNGAELKVETVESGKGATAPADPSRSGYRFIGWDKEFNNITSDLIVTATYEKTYTEPTFVVQSVTADAGDTVTVAINVKNNPGILAMTLSLTYDDSALDLTNASNGNALSMLTMTSSKTLSSGCKFAWDGVEITEDDITDGEILVLTFVVSDNASSGSYDIVISYNEGDIYDNDINILSFDIENGSITVK